MGDVEEIKEQLAQAIDLFKRTAEQNNSIISSLLADNQRLHQEIEKLKSQKTEKKGMHKELEKRYKRKRKLLVQNRIIEMVRTREYSLPELKDLIVDELEYCSKATFYRYIEEIKRKGMIDVSREAVFATAMIR